MQMMRILFSASAVAALVLAVPAFAAGGDANALVNECSSPNLPREAVDSCLARAQAMDETDPSPQIQSLEAMLERRQAGAVSANAPPPPPSPYRQDQAVEQGAPIDVPSYVAPPPNAGGPPAQLGGRIQSAPMPPPNGAYQSPDEQGAPYQQGEPDEQGPPDAQGAPDDQGPPDQQEGPQDQGPPDANMQDDGPPTDERTPDDPDNGYDSQPPGE
jgi:hypothetical protein